MVEIPPDLLFEVASPSTVNHGAAEDPPEKLPVEMSFGTPELPGQRKFKDSPTVDEIGELKRSDTNRLSFRERHTPSNVFRDPAAVTQSERSDPLLHPRKFEKNLALESRTKIITKF